MKREHRPEDWIGRFEKYLDSVDQSDRTELEVEIVAYLSWLGLAQEVIAGAIGKSRSTVMKRLKEAMDEKILIPPTYHSKRQLEIQRISFGCDIGAEIQKWLGHRSRLNGVRVYPSADDNPREAKDWDKALDDFSRFAGERLRELAARSKGLLGITWGRTVWSIATRFTGLGPDSTMTAVQFVPTWGEPLDQGQGENPSEIFRQPISCSDIANRLHVACNASHPCAAPPPSLLGVPAVVPLSFEIPKVEVIKEFVNKVKGYRDVFGDSTNPESGALISKLDTLLTSVGAPEPLERFWSGALFQSLGLEQADERLLADTVYGDIGGVWIRKPDATGQGAGLLDRIQHRWFGIKLEHIEACAKQSKLENTPGVIVAAIGRDRAGVIFECLDRGLINELIIDQHLAGALLERIPKTRSSARPRP